MTHAANEKKARREEKRDEGEHKRWGFIIDRAEKPSWS
jgi:hypothetical protein